MLLALGAFAGVGATNGSLDSLISSVKNTVASQLPRGEDVSAVTTSNLASTTQQSGVADATTAYKKAGPAVVTIVNTMQATTGRGQFGQGGNQGGTAIGSGIIIDNNGDIVTNQHVVDGEQSLQVVFADGSTAPATLVGEDAYSDLAVVKVSVKVPAVANLGNSDQLEVGQTVVAIGTALGDYQNTVTEGIVSGLHRRIADGTTSTQDLIQTDAAINHGNSGGPLLDLSGNVVGINTAVVRSDSMAGDVAEGLGFAIPSNTVKNVTQKLMSGGSVSHPFVGISYQAITPAIATQNNLPVQQGIYVMDVAAGSPADKAGIQANSVITVFDGVTLGSDASTTLPTLIAKHNVGDSVKLTVIAPGQTTGTQITIVLAERPSGQ